MRIFVGLKRKLEFNLISPSGELLTPKPVQLLVIDAFPNSVDQSWGKLITDGFDADVIKCWADIDSDGQLTPISFSAGALNSVHNGQFEYTMRPCHSFPQMMKRLKKYRDRGFILSKFSFDERVSDEWREHIMQEFKLKYANRWWKEYVENADCAADGDDLPTIFTQNVLPYLGRFHGDNLSDGPIETTSQPDILDENQMKRHAIVRGMLRRNVLKELVRTGYHDSYPRGAQRTRGGRLHLRHVLKDQLHGLDRNAHMHTRLVIVGQHGRRTSAEPSRWARRSGICLSWFVFDS